MDRIKTTKDIGVLKGKTLVFGGVYSNLQALERMIAIAEELQIAPQNIICTGDVVAYCAQPEECVQKVMDWGIHTIAGNVEIQLREGEEDCGCNFDEGSRCNLFSGQWYPFAKRRLSEACIDWMWELPDFISFELAGLQGLVVHGSLQETAEFVFKSTSWEVKAANLEQGKVDIVLAGHCGLPFHDVRNGQYWLNAGVIGMPANDGTTRVWYMVLEAEKERSLAFSHHSFDYNCEETARLMGLYSLTPEYAKTLVTGLWDNCEVLPDSETKLQGIEICF
ncbi:MAG: metallophosphoesterase family protein [Chitinophagales bacterium]